MTTLPRIDWTLEGILWGIGENLKDVRWHCKTIHIANKLPFDEMTSDFTAEDLIPENTDCICQLTPTQLKQIIVFPSSENAVEIQLPDESVMWESNPVVLKDLLKNLKKIMRFHSRNGGKTIKGIKKVSGKESYKLLLI